MQAMEIKLYDEEAEDVNEMDVFTVKKIEWIEGHKVVTLEWSRK